MHRGVRQCHLRQLWHLHRGKEKCAQPHLLHRVADQYHHQTTSLLNYEIALFEDGSAPQFIYANMAPAPAANDSQLVVGTKRDDACFVQFGCYPSDGQSPPVSTRQQITLVCAAPSPIPAPRGTTTLSPRPTPTPRPRPTPYPRP